MWNSHSKYQEHHDAEGAIMKQYFVPNGDSWGKGGVVAYLNGERRPSDAACCPPSCPPPPCPPSPCPPPLPATLSALSASAGSHWPHRSSGNSRTGWCHRSNRSPGDSRTSGGHWSYRCHRRCGYHRPYRPDWRNWSCRSHGSYWPYWCCRTGRHRRHRGGGHGSDRGARHGC